MTEEYIEDVFDITKTVEKINKHFGEHSMALHANSGRKAQKWEFTTTIEFGDKKLKNEDLDKFLDCFDDIWSAAYCKSEFINTILPESRYIK